MCDNSHLSFEFITRKSDGLLLYNGPIVPPEVDEIMVSGKIFILFYMINYTINNVLIIFFFHINRFYLGRIGARYTEVADRFWIRYFGIESETKENLGRWRMASA